MITEAEEKTNGNFDEKELADFREQLRLKYDRDQRTKAVVEAWNKFQAFCKEQRCSFNPILIATERSNTFQFQINAE